MSATLEVPIVVPCSGSSTTPLCLSYESEEQADVVLERQKALLQAQGWQLSRETSVPDGYTEAEGRAFHLTYQVKDVDTVCVLVRPTQAGGSACVITARSKPLSPQTCNSDHDVESDELTGGVTPIISTLQKKNGVRRGRQEEDLPMTNTAPQKKTKDVKRSLLAGDIEPSSSSDTAPIKQPRGELPTYPAGANPVRAPCKGCHGAMRHGLDFYQASTAKIPEIKRNDTCIRHFVAFCRAHHKSGCPNEARCRIGHQLYELALKRK